MSAGQKAWSWCHAFCQSDLPPTTKHVLHTLHMFMNALGESCFPSVEEIVSYSGLSKRAVLQHLKIAREAGWIEMQQHGFRGRRWRRQEYVPRWPERDLVASCPPDPARDAEPNAEPQAPPNGEEGGAPAAPPQTNEVVHEVHRGGAPAAPEVVHEGHRVIETNPVTNPKTNPIERERARAGAPPRGPEAGLEAGPGSRSGSGPDPEQTVAPPVTRETWLARLRRAHKDWPTYATDSADTAQAAWFDLPEAERTRAAELLPAFVAHARGLGRSKFCTFAVYLREKRWERLPPKAGTMRRGNSELAPPFGKAWGAVRFHDLMRAPYGRMPVLTRFQEQLIAQGGDVAARELRARTARYGWPKVNALQDDALRRRRGTPHIPALEGLATLFDKVQTGSELFDAWRACHEARGWPFLGETRDLPEWIYMPAPPEPFSAYASLADAVRAAMARFETAHANLQKNEAAE